MTVPGRLAVGDGVELHYEVSGTAGGIPALYLHGGPGGRLGTGYRDRAAADRFHLVGLSQRGAGASTPAAGAPGPVDLSRHTTGQLVADIEVLREHLGISAWVVQGVSWGTTLALAYAQRHPQRVRAVVLFAVTTTSRREVDWITEGVGALYPEVWDAFAGFAERHGGFDRHASGPGRLRIVEAYRRMLTGADPALVDAAAAAWCTWEDEHIRIGAPPEAADGVTAPIDPADLTAQQRGLARLVTHYWAHDGFVADWALPWGGEPGSGLLGGMGRLDGIPGVLIHGRRDVSGPARTAWEVHRAWPGSELIMVEEEGHGGPRMVARWQAAMSHLAGVMGP